MSPLERARVIAQDCLPRVIARHHYHSDNEHAVAARRGDLLEIVQRIISIRKKVRKCPKH